MLARMGLVACRPGWAKAGWFGGDAGRLRRSGELGRRRVSGPVGQAGPRLGKERGGARLGCCRWLSQCRERGREGVLGRGCWAAAADRMGQRGEAGPDWLSYFLFHFLSLLYFYFLFSK